MHELWTRLYRPSHEALHLQKRAAMAECMNDGFARIAAGANSCAALAATGTENFSA